MYHWFSGAQLATSQGSLSTETVEIWFTSTARWRSLPRTQNARALRLACWVAVVPSKRQKLSASPIATYAQTAVPELGPNTATSRAFLPAPRSCTFVLFESSTRRTRYLPFSQYNWPPSSKNRLTGWASLTTGVNVRMSGPGMAGRWAMLASAAMLYRYRPDWRPSRGSVRRPIPKWSVSQVELRPRIGERASSPYAVGTTFDWSSGLSLSRFAPRLAASWSA